MAIRTMNSSGRGCVINGNPGRQSLGGVAGERMGQHQAEGPTGVGGTRGPPGQEAQGWAPNLQVMRASLL